MNTDCEERNALFLKISRCTREREFVVDDKDEDEPREIFFLRIKKSDSARTIVKIPIN
jgi:hypothetical protein